MQDPRVPSSEPVPPSAQRLHSHYQTLEQQAEAASLGMWVFLATEVLFFSVLFMGYTYLRWSYPDVVAAASRHLELPMGGLNTLILLTSSFIVAAGVLLAPGERRLVASRCFFFAALMGIAFLAIKGTEYFHAIEEGLFPRAGSVSSPRALFFWLYFVMTGLHAVHVGVGVVLLFCLSHCLRRPQGISLNIVRNGGLYWHFVDLVWVFLFPLLYLAGHRTGFL